MSFATAPRVAPAIALAAALLAGCSATVRHQVDPIHITLDVNLKVDRELDEFFAFEEQIEQEVLESRQDPAAPPDDRKVPS